MRAIALVDKIEFQFSGNVARNAITLGDVDNDGCYELVVGNSAGDVAVFKGKEKVQTFSELGFVVCITVGDIFNKQQNNLVIVTADGWFYIYENTKDEINEKSNIEPSQNVEQHPHDNKRKKPDLLKCIHIQRIPANVKNIVLGDIDEDGKIEVIFGLTDRVVRTYRWLDEIDTNTVVESRNNTKQTEIPVLGRLVALNKWECANQIGSLTLHHSIDNKAAILVAQPGGTFMRIRCQPDDGNNSYSSMNPDQNEPPTDDPLSSSTIDYQYLCRSRMRNENISTEIIGDFKTVDKGSGARICPYAVATLDGTIMLVQDEEIRWEIAVNHQIFALTKLDVTGNGADDIVVCSWDGQTYFLDQDKNCVSFNLDEPVQAFDSGYYNLSTDQAPVTALVYVTFKNTVIVYYDIPLKDMVIQKYNIDSILIDFLMKRNDKTRDETEEFVSRLDGRKKSKLVSFLLYGDDDNK